MAVKLKKIGTNIHLTDSKDKPIVEFGLYGKAEQMQYSGKNLLSTTLESGVHSGITHTKNPDRTYLFNGTCTSTVWLHLASGASLKKGTYILSGVPISNSGFVVYIDKDGSRLATDGGNGATFTLSEDVENLLVVVRIEGGYTANNILVKPMISVEGGEYEPFVGNMPSPSPDYPQDITVSGADGSVEVKSVGKNLFNGIQASGQYTSGVWQADNNRLSTDLIEIESRTISFSLNSSALNMSFINLNYFDKDKNWLGNRASLGLVAFELTQRVVTATFPESAKYVSITARGYNDNNTAINLLTLTDEKLMIEESPIVTEYEPYKETSSTIPTPNGLAGIKVSSGGNYTDENGQQWITDEIVKYADGSGKRIERIKHYSLAVADMNNSENNPGWKNISDLSEVAGVINNRVSNALCNVGNNVGVNTLNGNSTIFLTSSVYGLTQTEWKANYPDLVVDIYIARIEPIITDLTAEEIAEIKKLYTFYPVTNISNDADCGMAVTYISTLLEFLQPKTDWTSSSRFDIEDYNRIKNNLSYLYDVSLSRIGTFDIEDMGEDLTVNLDENKDWDVNVFNAFENNLHTINSRVTSRDIGSKKTFHENGVFPDYAELNRIESATLMNKTALENLSAGLRRIPFKFGRFKSRL